MPLLGWIGCLVEPQCLPLEPTLLLDAAAGISPGEPECTKHFWEGVQLGMPGG